MRPIIASLLGCLLLLASFAPVAYAQGTTPDCTTSGFVRVINVGGGGGVDIFVNGTRVAENVAAGATSTLIPVTAGEVRLRINRTGTETVLVQEQTITVGPGGRITLFTVGQTVAGSGQQPATSTVTTQVLTDDASAPAAGQARVRFFLTTADLGEGVTGVDLLANDTPIATNITFGGAVPAAVELPSGRVVLRVVRTGTTTNVIGPTDLDLVAGRTYTIFPTGAAATTNLALTTNVDRSFDAQARFVHAAPGAPAIDVLIDGRPVVSNLAFPNASPFVPIPAEGACAVIVPTGTTTPIPGLAPLTVQLPSAGRATVVIQGLPGDATTPLVTRIITESAGAPAAGMARIRAIHASPDAGPVDVKAGATTIATGLTFGTESPYVDVAPGTGTVQITITRAGTTDALPGLTPIDLPVVAGQSITLVLRGRASDQSLGVGLITEVSGG